MTRDAANPLSAASQALADKSRRLTPPRMVSCLFGRAPVEDLAQYTPDALASLATSAHEHLMAPRRPGHWDIRLLDFEMVTEEHRREYTVVQVVNDDMPFLLDSTLSELTDQGYEPHLVAHPILAVKRDDEGELVGFEGEATLAPRPSIQRESLIHIHIDRIDRPEARERLIAGLQRVYADVSVSVADWSKMRARLIDVIGDYRDNPPPLPQDETEEGLAFLDWIVNDNFTILGVREYRFPDGDAAADVVEGSGLGILRDPSVKVLRRGAELVIMTPEIREFLQKQPRGRGWINPPRR